MKTTLIVSAMLVISVGGFLAWRHFINGSGNHGLINRSYFGW